ncbi:MAG: NusG domain II-containing protein [Eubacteriales bacterium]|nr:NusG domain II-containing protein [Eubacteriales bacterium]
MKKNCLKIKKADIILLCSLLICAVLIWVITEASAKGGDYITVSTDGEIRWTLSLEEDTEMVISRGEKDYNILVISGGKAWVSEASCPDLKCVHMKKISRDGECIICLPNRLIIQVHSDKDSDVDSIVQ